MAKRKRNIFKTIVSNDALRAVTILLGFIGIGAGGFRGILEMTNQDIVAKDSYVKIKDLPKEYMTKEECIKEFENKDEYRKNISELKSEKAKLKEIIGQKRKILEPLKIKAEELRQLCDANKNAELSSGRTSIHVDSLCREAGAKLVEVQAKEEDIKFLENEFSILVDRIKEFEKKL